MESSPKVHTYASIHDAQTVTPLNSLIVEPYNEEINRLPSS